MKVILAFLLLTFTFLLNNIYAQNTPQGQEQQPRVVEIGEIRIEARMELPQVQIIDKRIKPDFEAVRVEKSFALELSGTLEQIQITPLGSRRIKSIKNLEELLNKKRF